MAAFLIATLTFEDKVAYQRYKRAFPAVFSRFDGRVFVADEQPLTIEGSVHADKVVILEFTDEAEAQRFVADPAYQAIAVDRQRGTRSLVWQVVSADSTPHGTAQEAPSRAR